MGGKRKPRVFVTAICGRPLDRPIYAMVTRAKSCPFCENTFSSPEAMLIGDAEDFRNVGATYGRACLDCAEFEDIDE